MRSSLVSGLCLAGLIMAVGVMAGPSDPLTSEELSNLEEGKAGVVGEGMIVEKN